jgi:hypothetical protein
MFQSGYNVRYFKLFYLIIAALTHCHAFAEEDVLHNPHKFVTFGIVEAIREFHSQYSTLFVLPLITVPNRTAASYLSIVLHDLLKISADQLLQITLNNKRRLRFLRRIFVLAKKISIFLYHPSNLRTMLVVPHKTGPQKFNKSTHVLVFV